MAQKFSKSKQSRRKPSWAVAPEWAHYRVLDRDGEWLWHEEEPEIDSRCVVWTSEGQMEHAAWETDPEVLAGWKTSCEERPPV